MENWSSKNEMKYLEPLNSIKRVAPRPDLYPQILNKINEGSIRTLPVFWARAAAIAFVCLFSYEVNMALRGSEISNNQTQGIYMSTTNNNLYDEVQ
ncbi:MAG: hypothetical protein ACI8ZN_001765 [Bacteroidia bacterium]|jgi:hypothetical protein